MKTMQSAGRIYNFSAGPAVLPLPVLERVQREMLCLPGAGASVLEISHRSSDFDAIHQGAQQRLRELLGLPDGYRILLLQGGSRLQFAMTAMNLLPAAEDSADYVVTGSWSSKAYQEAQKLATVKLVWDGKPHNYDRVPTPDQVSFNPGARYVYVASNETIQGVQFASELETGGVPLVCDASSDFLCRPLDISRYGLIYACAQKNAGPAGLTIVILKEDWLELSRDDLPGYLNYGEHAAADSRYNTPPTFAIYVFGLVAEWLQEQGGLDAMQRRNRAKADLLYAIMDASEGFYQGHAQPQDRSIMNVTFRLPSAELEQEFLRQASERGLESLKGHRSVGGIRASIYNAMPEQGVAALRDFMVDFRNRIQA